jgi:AcrR family transcriptional regulator
MAPRPDVRDERKRQILNAAEEVFSEKGLNQARMDDIAHRTGLSKGTLYLYFKSKSDLIIAILDRMFQGEFRRMEDLARDPHIAPQQAIWEFAELAIKDLTRMLRLMPIAYEFLALAFRNKTVQKALSEYLRRYMRILTPIIQRGIDTGEFRQVDATEVAIAAGAIFEGTILLWVYDKSIVQPERHIRSSLNLLLESIQAPS